MSKPMNKTEAAAARRAAVMAAKREKLTERQRLERWALKILGSAIRHGHGYAAWDVQSAWRAWQASARAKR